MTDEIIKAEAEAAYASVEGHHLTHEERDAFVDGFLSGWAHHAARKADPTELVEHVARKLWGHFRPANRGDVAWDDLSPVDKQGFKQNIVGVLYATLEALTEQGLIGGIDNG